MVAYGIMARGEREVPRLRFILLRRNDARNAFRAYICGQKVSLVKTVPKVFAWARTFILVNIGMLIFRADNLSAAFDMFVSVFSFAPVHLTKLINVEEIVVVLVALVLLLGAEIYGNKGYDSDVLLKKKWSFRE